MIRHIMKTTVMFFLIFLTTNVFSVNIHITANDSTEIFNFREIEDIEVVEIQPEMVFVEGGTFQMGDRIGDLHDGCRPVHFVTLDDFYIGKYEVTQYEWEQYMIVDVIEMYGVGDFHPISRVSWYEILVYCNKRSIAEGLTPCYSIKGTVDTQMWGIIPFYNSDTGEVVGDKEEWDAVICNWDAEGYRLPTEAEWEYAARGGKYSYQGYLYSGTTDELDKYAWYKYNCYPENPLGTQIIGRNLPNQLGIYGMSGNVSELCWDWFDGDYPTTEYFYYQYCYDQGTVSNPKGPDSGTYKVYRGGYWFSSDIECRVAFRDASTTFLKDYTNGLRIVKSK